MLTMRSVDLAIDEMRYARRELGMRGGFLRPNPYKDRMLHDPSYEPFWTMAEELDFSIGFYEGSNSSMPTVGVDRFEDRAARHMISHTMEMMLAAMSMIWGGMCERHPRLRIAFLESGGGWIAHWLDRMDRHFGDQGFNGSSLKMRPIDLFKRNCWILFEPVEGSLSVLARLYRPAQDHVGDRLSALGRLPPSGAADDPRTPRAAITRDKASGDDRGRDGVLRPALRPGMPGGRKRSWARPI